MQHTVRSLSPESLRRLGERDDCSVYEYRSTHTFEPWAADRVRACMRALLDACHVHDTAAEVRAAARARLGAAEFDAFAANYTKCLEKLSDPPVARKHGEMFLFMTDLRARIETGELTEDEARTRLSEATMRRVEAEVRT